MRAAPHRGSRFPGRARDHIAVALDVVTGLGAIWPARADGHVGLAVAFVARFHSTALTSYGRSSGCRATMRAAKPATHGAAKELPVTVSRFPPSQATVTSRPGAPKSAGPVSAINSRSSRAAATEM